MLIALTAPALIRPPQQASGFDHRWLESPASWFFIGDSMLYTRIDPARLSERLGAPARLLALGGSEPPHWHLALKNVAAELRPAPDRVFIFFRGRQLTEPFAAVSGIQRPNLRLLSHADEPELDAIFSANRDLPGKVAERLGRIYPVAAESDRLREYVGLLAATPLTPGAWRLMVPTGLDAGDAEAVRLARDDIRRRANLPFAEEHLRTGPAASAPPLARKPLDEELPTSFLPLLLNTAERSRLQLVFVRVETRRRADADELAYLAALRNYLAQHGASYLDMAALPAITDEWFGEGDHIAASRLGEYTDYFYSIARSALGGASDLPKR